MAQIPAHDSEQPLFIYFPTENCQACNVATSELYSRTFNGKKYCTDCLKKGAGIEEYTGTLFEAVVSEELKERARKNGFLKPSE